MSETKRKVPKLRFPGFTEDWEQRKFMMLLKKLIDYRGKTPKKLGETWSKDGHLALSAINVKMGHIDKTVETYYGDDNLYNKWMQGNHLYKGQVLMTMEAPMGNIAQIPDDEKYILSQRTIALVPNEEIIDDFLATVLMGSKFQGELLNKASGGTAKGVSQKTLNEILITIPTSRDEQYVISRFMKVFDNLITLHQRKLENLKLKKKALLQKLFPKNGEQFPELRFPGFTDAWEQRKLGELYERVNERNDGTLGRDKWISVAKMYFQNPDKVQSNNLDTRTYVMQRGDIAFEGHPNNEFKFGRFVLNDIGTGIISELFPIYRPIVRYDLNFWKYAIQLERTMAPIFAKSITSSGNSSNKLDQNHFLQQSITIPTVEEQKVIGSFLENISNLVTLHQRKLEHLQLQKKALLQQMFV